MSLRMALLSFAQEVFREQADKDYIAARSCYRMNLREQFLWASLQSCEKLLKGTLLFNNRSARYATYDPIRKKGKEFGHDLNLLFGATQKIQDLPLDNPPWLPNFLKYLTTFGNNRYLTRATFARGEELHRLDEAVWVLRRVCQNFEWVPRPNVNFRPALLTHAKNPKNRATPVHYKPFGVIDGFLEKVLKASRSDPTRLALVWNNLFFGSRQRRSVTYTQFSSSENPPQARGWFNDPVITGQIDYYIKLN